MTLLSDHPLPPAVDVPPPGRPRRRLRVLVGAYAVSPARGSEPGVGWGICRALAELHDLTVLTAAGAPGPEHSVFRDEVDAHLARHGPVPGLALHYVPRPRLSAWLQKERELFRRTAYYAGYKAWQKAALAEAQRLHAGRPFDVVHQLNMTGFREPGYLWRLPGVPFVWGPIGGGANIPPAYFPIMDWTDRAFYTARNVGNEFQKRTAWRCRRAARRAAPLWTVGHQSRDLVERLWGFPSDVLLESGAAPRPEAAVRRRDPPAPLKVVWSGLHIGRKALPLLLHAMKAIIDDDRDGGRPRVETVVLGGGPHAGPRSSGPSATRSATSSSGPGASRPTCCWRAGRPRVRRRPSGGGTRPPR